MFGRQLSRKIGEISVSSDLLCVVVWQIIAAWGSMHGPWRLMMCFGGLMVGVIGVVGGALTPESHSGSQWCQRVCSLPYLECEYQVNLSQSRNLCGPSKKKREHNRQI
ncbi:hypothetical protein BDP55DRAFT_21668 [Colletotrichum godetiae]|uniref:Uncharacterized protein n=1 Tax=Colletotrichum godetiae TaxID=1209918 RepID=A0AAJ0B012_9PEZI|nr:uncharacterized protein BDP55DRAFT_21668 [Colletotrichum godetiae]KAK1701453.1 hypothetical protein BDP55DRAFT_21668 [Colletotrichum godetiae]